MRNPQQHQDVPRFIDLNMVKLRTGMGTTFIYDHMKKGDFPKGRKFGRATRWAEVEIDQYCNGTWTPQAPTNEAGAPECSLRGSLLQPNQVTTAVLHVAHSRQSPTMAS
ncbi:TPA: AlpA family phage regulatory protein [Pseudomonas aeruginosa]|nr:AlpA family phage regulatory protein [Pseudomonas aeruginosa]